MPQVPFPTQSPWRARAPLMRRTGREGGRKEGADLGANREARRSNLHPAERRRHFLSFSE